MGYSKKIVTLFVKLVFGVLSIWFVWSKLHHQVDANAWVIVKDSLFSVHGAILFFLVFLLVFPNWLIEAYKWQVITNSTEIVSYKTALKSVLGGLCAGNLAPGRATEFLVKILFFRSENRAQITLLHFLNGLIQLSVTLILGGLSMLQLYCFTTNVEGEASFYFYSSSALTLFLFLALALVFFKLEKMQQWLFTTRLFKKYKGTTFRFSKQLLVFLFGLSFLRYLIFVSQFFILLYLFLPIPITITHVFGICIYFLITTIVPMFSFVEPVIRAMIVLYVFGSVTNDYNIQLVLVTTLLWLLNIVLPSLVGYIIILREKFELSSIVRK